MLGFFLRGDMPARFVERIAPKLVCRVGSFCSSVVVKWYRLLICIVDMSAATGGTGDIVLAF
jgi:hypothetical protein